MLAPLPRPFLHKTTTSSSFAGVAMIFPIGGIRAIYNEDLLYRMFGIDYYDAILLSGDYQVQQIREKNCDGYVFFSATDFYRNGASEELGNYRNLVF